MSPALWIYVASDGRPVLWQVRYAASGVVGSRDVIDAVRGARDDR